LTHTDEAFSLGAILAKGRLFASVCTNGRRFSRLRLFSVSGRLDRLLCSRFGKFRCVLQFAFRHHELEVALSIESLTLCRAVDWLLSILRLIGADGLALGALQVGALLSRECDRAFQLVIANSTNHVICHGFERLGLVKLLLHLGRELSTVLLGLTIILTKVAARSILIA